MQTLEELKHMAIVAALDTCESVTDAARCLGMSRSSLYAYMKINLSNCKDSWHFSVRAVLEEIYQAHRICAQENCACFECDELRNAIADAFRVGTNTCSECGARLIR
jgi:hypothetical protein